MPKKIAVSNDLHALGPRKLRITTLFLAKDQWFAVRQLGKIRGFGKRGAAIIVREAIDQYLDRVAKAESERRAARDAAQQSAPKKTAK